MIISNLGSLLRPISATRSLLIERNPAEVIVSQIMNTPLVTVKEGMSLKECARLMKQHRIHHLPVENEEGTLVGMVSDTDFLVAAEAMGRAPDDKII